MSGSFPNNQGNPAGAIPVYLAAGSGDGAVTYSDFSDDLNVDTPATLVPAQPTRKYLFIQPITPLVGVWVNWFNDDASPETSSSFFISPGESYESGLYVAPGAISLVATDDCSVTITVGV